MRSKRLSRQLKKIIGEEDVTLESLGFENDTEPVVTEYHLNILKHLPTLLDHVELTYEQFDKMIELSNRSLEISTNELSTANESLMNLNATVNAMINSLNEGFVVFDRAGKCTSISSKRASEFLGTNPFGKTIWEAFSIPTDEQDLFIDWYNYLFNPNFDFQEMAAIGPDRLNHDNLHIAIKYKPMFKDEELVGIIAILSDITSEIQSAKRAETFMHKVEMITNFYANQNMFMSVLDLFSKSVQDFKAIAYDLNAIKSSKSKILRTLHTLKGCSAAMYMMDLANTCEHHENSIKESWTENTDIAKTKEIICKLSEDLAASLRDFNKLNKELLGTRRGAKATEGKTIALSSIENFHSVLKTHGNIQLLNHFVDEFFTTSFEQLLIPFENLGYSTAKNQNKEIEISLACDPEIRVFPEAYKQFINAFIHIINNAIDHGLEDVATRAINNKNKIGSLAIEAKPMISNNDMTKIILTVKDDGNGINPARIRKKLTERGVDTSKESDAQVINHIFDFGFSTRDAISEMSGRGVGLNALYEEIIKLGGHISVTSEIGKGTQFLIVLPLIKPNSNQVNEMNLVKPTRFGYR